jgi:undecaprenyl diphosphate synthase
VAIFSSSTATIPDVADIPKHIAIIMDGNGRWAKKRFLPRVAGHKVGLETVREVIKQCVNLGVDYLTLFAFSSENWRRPPDEVSFLMSLFMDALKKEVRKLHKNNVRFIMIGNKSQFNEALAAEISAAELLTTNNTGLTLTIAANYGGRWDILQAVNSMHQANPELVGNYTEDHLAPYLSMHYAPEPDLFIRTGGEKRVSNFLLWQLAYTEFYFTDTLWPDFDQDCFDIAIQSYQKRERRFGRTSEQLVKS